MRRGGMTVPALVVAALILPACGGDDDGGDVSREDYAERVNKVCDNAERELRELNVGSAETSADVTALIDEVIVKSRAAVDRLKALERPGGEDGETADRFVDTLGREFEEVALPALEDLKQGIRNEDRQTVANAARRLNELETAESDRFARELGADNCAA
jgi:hypothetical protein